uniref:Uncharacterized protein n=1 Tax=Anguilla anguilla TaxID=7936 RepID=A0A0E9Q691_ANGAN
MISFLCILLQRIQLIMGILSSAVLMKL